MGLYLRKDSYCNYAVAHCLLTKLELLHLKSMELHQFAQAEELAKSVLVTYILRRQCS